MTYYVMFDFTNTTLDIDQDTLQVLCETALMLLLRSVNIAELVGGKSLNSRSVETKR